MTMRSARSTSWWSRDLRRLTEFAADQGVDDLIVINYPYMINSKAFIRYLNALAGVQ